MINKRQLIKNIISHNDECSFFDKKYAIDIKSNKGKAKLLKHICALTNSNPKNDSFIIVGVSNNNKIDGTVFIDDSTIQNLINAFLKNPPSIKYENISFPNLPRDKSVGIMTIKNNCSITSFKKKISTIEADTIYHRVGSKSEPTLGKIKIMKENKDIVSKTYLYSQINIKNTIDGIFEFFGHFSKEYNPSYLVFKDQFVVCWSGYKMGEYYNEVDIEIVNEGTKLFFSAIHEVKVKVTDNVFNLVEFQILGFNGKFDQYPTFSNSIVFYDNGTYKIEKDFIFSPPKFPIEEMNLLYKESKEFEKKFLDNQKLNAKDWEFGEGLANYYFLCYLNGIKEARNDFVNSGFYLDGAAAEWHSECASLLKKFEKR